MNQWKWVNQFQPQTLYMATILCYVDAVFGLLFGFVATSVLAGLITIAALAAGGFGIANEKKWGYAVAVGGAILQVVMLFAVFGTEVLTSLGHHQPPVRRRARRPAPPPDEPRVPAHLVQVSALGFQRFRSSDGQRTRRVEPTSTVRRGVPPTAREGSTPRRARYGGSGTWGRVSFR